MSEDSQTANLRTPFDRKVVIAFAKKVEELAYHGDETPEAATAEALKWCRDELEVNAARSLDRMNYQIAQNGDVYKFAFDWSDEDEEWFQLFDPVFPESEEEGGSADIREGDVVEFDRNGKRTRAEVVRVGANQAEIENESGVTNVFKLVVIRNALRTTNMRLFRDGDVLIGEEHTEVLGGDIANAD